MLRSTSKSHASADAKPSPADPRVTRATEAERRALEALEKRVRAGLSKGEAIAWKVGRDFDEIARRGLHHAAHFATLQDYAEARFPQGWTTLKRFRRVALAFTQATVKKYGTTKLDLGLTYIGLTPEHERPAELPALEIRVPAGGSFARVPFAKVKVSELVRAIEAAKAKPDAYDGAIDARAKRVRADIQEAIAAPKGTHTHAPTVRAHPTDHGTIRVDILAIDLDDYERVAKAMLAHAKTLRAKKRRT